LIQAAAASVPTSVTTSLIGDLVWRERKQLDRNLTTPRPLSSGILPHNETKQLPLIQQFKKQAD
jgi:hypothetical protein